MGDANDSSPSQPAKPVTDATEDADYVQLAEQLSLEEDWKDPSEGGVLGKVMHVCEEGGGVDQLADLLGQLNVGVDTKGEDGDTALHLACLYGRTDCALLLLEKNADPRATDEDDSTPLHDAAAGGFLDIVRKLLELAPELVNAKDSEGDTPLHNAARGGCLDTVRYLLENGADKNMVNSSFKTPEAVADEDTPLVAVMLREGV